MRILLLTILFLAPLYYFTRGSEPLPESDSIELKASAPDRIERILTVEQPKVLPSETPSEGPSAEVEEEGDDTTESEDRSPAVDASDEVEEVHMSDLEDSWNSELKQILNRFEPADGEEIHKAYLQEQESYRAMVDGLMSDSAYKTSNEASLEVEQMIQQLEHKHQERLKEILGPHYEAVRDAYDEYMESSSQEE